MIQTISEERCAFCGAEGAEVVDTVNERLESADCLLCGSPLPENDSKEAADLDERLRLAAEHIVALEASEETALKAVERARHKVDSADLQLRELAQRLEAFRSANSQALLRGAADTVLVEEATRGLHEQINDLLKQKDAELERRDAARLALDDLRDQLTARFAEMEDEFIPLLQNLAYEFLGVALQVDLERRGAHVALNLSLAGSERRRPDTLSESQRLFLDIALRMALARKIAKSGSPATLYIDTPEGSLDIAYEGRAGRMFGLFAQDGNRVVMTANINTSQLLQELASVCGRDRMHLERMTNWTDLTDVQQEDEELFDQAYNAIEARLDAGGA